MGTKITPDSSTNENDWQLTLIYYLQLLFLLLCDGPVCLSNNTVTDNGAVDNKINR